MKTPTVGERYLLREFNWEREIKERTIAHVSNKYIKLSSPKGYEYWVSKEEWDSYEILDQLESIQIIAARKNAGKLAVDIHW